MDYTFTNKREYTEFISKLREGVDGIQSTIYFDDKNNKAIKVFSLDNQNFNSRKKENKLRELMKLRGRFPTVALPERIITCQGKCVGYVMSKLPDAMSLEEFQFKARKQQIDLKESLKIACELARFIEKLHSEDIIFGDFHSDQFMTKNGKIYVCDTDTWGFENKGKDYEADRAGRSKYIDPKVRDFEKSDIVITGYTKQSDYFSLAVVVFEMLVGFNPYDGIYPLVKGYDRPLRALNHISILGNHKLKSLDSFQMKHVAWMSEELQRDFLQIFEGDKRFNILTSLEKQSKDLKKCPKLHYYNSSRYSECPCCNTNQKDDALKRFRDFNVDAISFERKSVFVTEQVRKIVNFSTFLDYDGNAIHLKEDGLIDKAPVTKKTEEVYFTKKGVVIKVSRMSKIKQFIYSFNEKTGSDGSQDFNCNLEVFSPEGKMMFSTSILRLSSKMIVVGNHIFYLNAEKKLIDVYMTKEDCTTKVITTITDPFIYEINTQGEYCMCIINTYGHLNIIVNGELIMERIEEFPRIIKYDSVSQSWCVITMTEKKVYKVYVIEKDNKASQKFNFFSFRGLNLKNCIFYNSMLIIPDEKKILFLKNGQTVEKSTVNEKQINVVNSNSKITVQYNSCKKHTYLYIQNSDKVYKISLS